MRVCIDPGHGGNDRGAIVGAVQEADVVLVYADALADEMRKRGHTVTMTRTTDTDLAAGHTQWNAAAKSADLRKRCQTSNNAHADAFISLHCNAGYASMNGAWVLHAKGSRKGQALAEQIFLSLSNTPGLTDSDPRHEVYSDASPAVGYTEAAHDIIARRPKGSKVSNPDWLAASDLDPSRWYRTIYVLRGTIAPAVLVELGFITNRDDNRQLTMPETPRQVAVAIADALKWWQVGKAEPVV